MSSTSVRAFILQEPTVALNCRFHLASGFSCLAARARATSLQTVVPVTWSLACRRVDEANVQPFSNPPDIGACTTVRCDGWTICDCHCSQRSHVPVLSNACVSRIDHLLTCMSKEPSSAEIAWFVIEHACPMGRALHSRYILVLGGAAHKVITRQALKDWPCLSFRFDDDPQDTPGHPASCERRICTVISLTK